MPSRRDICELFFCDRVQHRLRGSALRAEIDNSREEHARVEEDFYGQRLRSSSINAAMSMAGLESEGAVGRATSRRPTLTSLGPEATRSILTAESSNVSSSSAPAESPARSRIEAGITTRPALSMVVFIPSHYHAWAWASQ